MASMTNVELLAEARLRYQFDPIFHARAKMAADAIGTGMKELGTDLSPEMLAMLSVAAGVGMVLVEIDPQTGERLPAV